MITIRARNVNDAFAKGRLLFSGDHAVRRGSRNGNVLVCREPVSTHYVIPTQRVLFDPVRDANPFFHVMEALWMLAGRDDVAFIARYLPRFTEYSDDGTTLHGAYGARWLGTFWRSTQRINQLDHIVEILRADHTDRRAVLQMWSAELDLGVYSKDLPCNLMAHFQVDTGTVPAQSLNMTVFNRSNDAIWGCYGANAVHFSFLQEYIAARLGIRVGWYEQISANLHVYEALLAKEPWSDPPTPDPYTRALDTVDTVPLVQSTEYFPYELRRVVQALATYGTLADAETFMMRNTFFDIVVRPLAQAHLRYREHDLNTARDVISRAVYTYGHVDWLIAAQEWIARRIVKRDGR